MGRRSDAAQADSSSTTQFIFVTWIGPNVRVMRKARISVQSADVKNVLRQFSIEVPASSLEDLDEVRFLLLGYVGIELMKMVGTNRGGASYDKA